MPSASTRAQDDSIRPCSRRLDTPTSLLPSLVLLCLPVIRCPHETQRAQQPQQHNVRSTPQLSSGVCPPTAHTVGVLHRVDVSSWGRRGVGGGRSRRVEPCCISRSSHLLLVGSHFRFSCAPLGVRSSVSRLMNAQTSSHTLPTCGQNKKEAHTCTPPHPNPSSSTAPVGRHPTFPAHTLSPSPLNPTIPTDLTQRTRGRPRLSEPYPSLPPPPPCHVLCPVPGQAPRRQTDVCSHKQSNGIASSSDERRRQLRRHPRAGQRRPCAHDRDAAKRVGGARQHHRSAGGQP